MKQRLRDWLNVPSREELSSPSNPPPLEIVVQTPDPAPSSDDIYYSTVHRQLSEQISIFSTLESQSIQIFSIGSLALPVTLSIIDLAKPESDASGISLIWSLPISVSVGMAVGALSYVAMAALLLIAMFHIKGMSSRPDTSYMKNTVIDYDGETVRLWVADEMQQSIVANTKPLQYQSVYVGSMKFLLVLEVAGFALMAIGVALLGTQTDTISLDQVPIATPLGSAP